MGDSLICDTRLWTHYPSLLATLSVSNMAYALHLAIAARTLVHLCSKANRSQNTPAIVLVSLLLAAGTVNIVLYLIGASLCGREMLIGAAKAGADSEALADSEVETDFWNPWPSDADMGLHKFAGPDLTRGQDSAALFICLLAQCYLLYRCHVLLGRWSGTIGLSVLMLIVLVFGLINIILHPSDPDVSSTGVLRSQPLDPLQLGNQHFTRVTWGLLLAFNLAANTLIIGRLLWLRGKVKSALGKEHARVYIGMAAMVLDSSVLYTTVLVVAYVWLPGSGGTWNLFSPVVAQTEAIATELIILRVLLGRALSKRDVVSITEPGTGHRLEHTTSTSSSEQEQDKGIFHRARVQLAIQSGLSQFPSSIAAVLRSHQAETVTTRTTTNGGVV